MVIIVLPNTRLWVGGLYSLWLPHVFACHACFNALGVVFVYAVDMHFYGQKLIPTVFSINGKGNNCAHVMGV